MICMLIRFNYYVLKRAFVSLLITLFFLLPGQIFAADCVLSPYSGRAALNEFFKDKTTMAENDNDFIEIKILDTSISQTTFENWSIQICEFDDTGNQQDGDGCSGSVSVSTFTDKSSPWIVLKSTTSANIGLYINFKTGFDAVLRDESGYVIDYISVDGRNAVETLLGCSVTGLPFDYQASSPGASDKFIFRTPDGTGDWDSAPSASAPATENNSNDTAPDGSTPPVVSIANVTVNKGDIATFTFELQSTARTYDITILYETRNGTAIAGTDYTYTTGTATIPAGSTSVSVGVQTNASSTSSTVYFYLYLSNAVNATLENHFPTGTILDRSLHHIEIHHDGSALTCEPESITLRACANSDCSISYTGDVSVTLSPTGWVGGDTQIISGGSGTLPLRHSVAEAVTLAVSSSSPVVSNATRCLNTATGAASCILTYYDTGFIYSIPTQTSCQTSVAITVSAVRKDATTQLCIPSFADRPETINFWAGYTNPTTINSQLTLNNGTTNYALATSSPGTDVPLSFNPSGQATITLNYPDAGQLTLNSRFDGAAGGPEAGLVMTGATTYVTKPAKLYVYSPDANADCESGDASCSAFTPAGSSFNLKVRGACDDVASTLTPNFIHNGITLTQHLIAPAGGDPGTLGVTSTNIVDADNGEATITTQSISEVGVFTIEASLGGTNYFGETVIGTTLLNTSANIGRFYPAYFDVGLLHSCNDDAFTYSGQSFTVNVTAYNAALIPQKTLNYDAGFVKNPVISNTVVTAAAATLTNNTLDSSHFTNGFGTRNDIYYSFDIKDTPAEMISLRAEDSDTVSSSGHIEPTTEVRSGRVNIENAFGSELRDLAVPTTVQYYDGSRYVTNTLDSHCTALTLALSDPDLTDSLTIGTGATGETCIRDDAGLSGPSNCTAVLGEQYVEPPASGNFNLWLKAPGAGHTGYMDVTGTVVPVWLQYNWNGAGLTNPSGRAAFGLFRGDDRIIYWREQY